MPDITIFLFGSFVFGLLGLGVGFTIAEFREMSRQADRRAQQQTQLRKVS